MCGYVRARGWARVGVRGRAGAYVGAWAYVGARVRVRAYVGGTLGSALGRKRQEKEIFTFLLTGGDGPGSLVPSTVPASATSPDERAGKGSRRSNYGARHCHISGFPIRTCSGMAWLDKYPGEFDRGLVPGNHPGSLGV